MPCRYLPNSFGKFRVPKTRGENQCPCRDPAFHRPPHPLCHETRNLQRWPASDSVSANITRNDEAAPKPARFRQGCRTLTSTTVRESKVTPAAVGRPDWVGEEPGVTRCTIREAGTCRFRLGLPIRPCGHTKIFWVRMSVSGRHLRVEPVYHPRWRREIVRRETVYWLKFSPLSLRRRVMCKRNASLPAHTQYVQADTTQRRLARGRHAGDSK